MIFRTHSLYWTFLLIFAFSLIFVLIFRPWCIQKQGMKPAGPKLLGTTWNLGSWPIYSPPSLGSFSKKLLKMSRATMWKFWESSEYRGFIVSSEFSDFSNYWGYSGSKECPKVKSKTIALLSWVLLIKKSGRSWLYMCSSITWWLVRGTWCQSFRTFHKPAGWSERISLIRALGICTLWATIGLIKRWHWSDLEMSARMGIRLNRQ